MKQKMTGIILAGGKNSRMGKKKAFLQVGGVRLIDNTLNVFLDLFSEVIIVTNEPLLYTEFTSAAIVTDIYKNKGALGGIYSGLFYSSCDYSFLAPCDMPFLNRDFILYLTGQVNKYDIVVPKPPDGFQPLHAIYSKNCLDSIRRHLVADKLKITGFYKEFSVLAVPEEQLNPFNKDGRLFLNINTQKELDLIRRNMEG